MKKKLFILIVIIVIVFLIRGCPPSCTDITGYSDYVETVENGNTIVLQSGLRVEVLGVEAGHTSAEMWIKNNMVGQMVTLVSDSGCEQQFCSTDDIVKAYVNIEQGGIQICVTRLIWGDCPDCKTLAYINDSTFQTPGPIPPVIHDPALYMKQRTMLVRVGSGAIGTAFFISKNGIALTNNHVLDGKRPADVVLYSEDAEDTKVYSNRRRNIKNILFTDPALDITIFSVDLENGEDIQFFNLIKKHEGVGKDCHILGNPLGYYASYSKGSISAYRDDEHVAGRHLVQYDIRGANGGNSGGPVMNDKGEIIAVHAMGVKQQADGTPVQGLSFGIDILQVRQILDRQGVNYGGR